MIFLAAFGCLAAAAAFTAVPALVDVAGERIARREWHEVDADWALQQLRCEQPDEPAAEPADIAVPLPIVEVTEP